MAENNAVIRFFADCGLITFDGLPTEPAMFFAGESHARPIYEECLANEEFCALALIQSLMEQFVEDANCPALMRLLNQIYDDSELEIPAAFSYFSDDVERHEQYLIAFCDGLAKRLNKMLYEIAEEEEEW